MGRKERRARERAEAKEQAEIRRTSVTLTRKELGELKDRMYHEAGDYLSKALLSCFLLVEHRTHGFGAVRLLRTMEAVDAMMGRIANGEITVEDCQQDLSDETGVEVEIR